MYDIIQRIVVDRLRKQFLAISTMSLQGLPPLPKSLSGFADGEPSPEPAPTADDKPPTNLDSQLTYLKKEMVSPILTCITDLHTNIPFSTKKDLDF